MNHRDERNASLSTAADDWARTADVIQDPLAIADARGVVTLANRAFRDRFAGDDGEAVGREVASLLFGSGQHREEIGAAYVTYEVSDLRIPGTFLVSQRPVDLESGIGLVYHLTDVTAFRAAEEAARRSEDQARQAQKMEAVGRLGAGVAHDFNNLLTVVLCNIELLFAQSANQPDVTEVLERIRAAAERGAGLVRRLLDFSRPQPGRPEVLDLNANLTDGAKLLWRIIGEHIRVDVVCAVAPARVRIDPTHFEQVLLNLSLNARDAMPAGGVLTIRTEAGPSADRPSVVLVVTDTGLGMSEEVRGRVFEPFFTTKEPGQGTGLGLAMVHAIVRQAGGEISIASRPGAGTEVRVVLPVVVGEPASLPAVSEPRLRGGSSTVLLVEDEQGPRAAIHASIASLGYQVLEAVDGPDALAIADQHPGSIDLLVSDVVMPGMSGFELAQTFSERRPSARVLLMSGYAAHQALDALETGEVGARVLAKPFTLLQLDRMLSEVLDSSVPA